MSYQTEWIDLSAAIELITKSNGASPEKTQAELSHAISDGRAQIRAKLDKHSSSNQTSSMTVSNDQIEIPRPLGAEDFNWTESRPFKSWRVHSVDRHRPGFWFLKDLEVCRANIDSTFLGQTGSSSDSGLPETPSRQKRQSPARKAAKIALDSCYPNVPPQHEVRNKELVAVIQKFMKENSRRVVSADSILRAAKRK